MQMFLILFCSHLQSFHCALFPLLTFQKWLIFFKCCILEKSKGFIRWTNFKEPLPIFFFLRNASSIWFAANQFSVSSIIIKHTQNHSVFPRIQQGWHWIGDSAWAPSGRVPMHLNYHVPSLCSDQSVSPRWHPLNHRPLPIHPLSVTELVYWAPSLSLETGCPASRLWLEKNVRKPKRYTSSSMTPNHPQTGRLSRWKRNNGIRQNWGEREVRVRGGEGARVAGKGSEIRPGLQSRRHHILLACTALASYLTVSSLGFPTYKIWNHSTYLEDWLWELPITCVKHVVWYKSSTYYIVLSLPTP